MEVIYRKLSDIKPLDKNPRKITKEQLETLKKSISENSEYFEARPIILSDRTGELVIIAGNQRYRACKELKYKEVPTILLSGLTEAKEREIIIRDNVNNGEWDDELLADWNADELKEWGVDLPDGWINEDLEEKAEGDGYEKPCVLEVKVKRGEIWQLGKHRLMCGDSTNIEDVRNLMGGVKCDLFLTDPPYNISYQGRTDKKLTIENDNLCDESFRAFLSDAFKCADEQMKCGAAFYIWHAGSEGYNFCYAVKNSGWILKQVLMWNKNRLVLGRQDYQWKHEPCLYGWKGGASHKWYSDRKQTTVMDFDSPIKNEEHPTMKPIELFSRLIENSSKKGDVVLDSFGGSGTTLIACEQLNRICYTMELSEEYSSVIVDRWEKFTGEKAVKIK